MRIFNLTVFFFLMLASALQAQQDLFPCGTNEGKVKWLEAYQLNPSAYPESDDTLYVPLTIHLVGKSDGTGFMSERILLESLCTLNEDFKPSRIQFFIEGQINYIANSTYFNHTFAQGSQMMNIYKVQNTLNCYIVESPAGNCGYSSYNKGIALAINCTQPWDHTWAHEAGHYFSLPHPFLGWEGIEHDYSQPAPNQVNNGRLVERADGQNCQVAADGFCDTPADYLNYRWNCNGDAESNVVQTDPTGENFRSDGTFFMSYSLEDNLCSNRFSDEQIAAMRANLLTEKAGYLYDQTPEPEILPEPLTILSPQDDAIWPGYQEVMFEWEAVPNATGYIVEIGYVPNFAVIADRALVYTPSYTSTVLPSNRTLYWRVKPFNNWYTCQSFSASQTFKTGTVSAVQDLQRAGRLAVYPNPGIAGASLQLRLDLPEPLDATLTLSSLSGQLIHRFHWSLPAGPQSREIPTAQLTPGVYLLHLQSEQGYFTEKIVLQP